MRNFPWLLGEGTYKKLSSDFCWRGTSVSVRRAVLFGIYSGLFDLADLNVPLQVQTLCISRSLFSTISVQHTAVPCWVSIYILQNEGVCLFVCFWCALFCLYRPGHVSQLPFFLALDKNRSRKQYYITNTKTFVGVVASIARSTQLL